MKKVSLLVAGAMLSAVVAQEASALPVFARQTGMACNACHFQHFPALNGFGRAFKASGYTLMGAQGKVEGEHLSIPDRVNLGVLTTFGYEQASAAPQNFGTPAYGGWFVPTVGGEYSIFAGGRATEFAGFLSEIGLTGKTLGTPTAKLLILPEVTDTIHAGVGVFSISQGAAGSFELLNTGAVSIHRLMGRAGTHISVTSARQYVAPEAGATGLAAIAVDPNLFFVNVSKYASTGPGTQSQANVLPGTYIRAAGMADVGAFEMAFGVQNWDGDQSNVCVAAATCAALGNDKATVFDVQAQGAMGEMPLGIYASYGTAPASAANGANNTFNPVGAGGTARTSFNVAAELGVIPGKATVQAAYRNGKSGLAANSTQTDGDNAIMLGGTYELAANMELSLTHTRQSGSAWDANTGVKAGTAGQNLTTLLVETLF